MAVIQNSFTGNGSTTTYSFTFPYLKTADIKASIDATVTTAFTLPSATTLQFNTAPANGAKIKIYRETDADALTATFYAGSALKSEDLNDNFTQNLYGVQEVTGRYMSNIGGTMTGDLTMAEDADIIFEGATDDAHETTLTVADPTADRTITIPNVTGTVVTTGDTGTVTSTMITDATIATGDLANSAVTGAKIADGAITTTKYGALSINVSAIGAGVVSADKLAANAVTTVKITDANVTTAKIAADAITGAKIADDAVDSEHLAADSIDAEHYAPGSVDATALASNSVTQAKLADDAVGPDELASSAVVTASIVDNAVTLAKMSDNSVGTAELVNDSVTNAKIANDQIDSEHYVDGSIDTAHIGDNQVTTAKIPDDAITTAKLADAELTTLAGMQSGTASILASGTALTSTTAELNLLDGKSVVTSISGSSTDVQLPTAKAVNDQIIALTADAGGFVPIANEVSFPNTNPDPNDDAGTIVSIADAGGIVVNGSGVSTTGRTLGGATVTINGIDSSLNSTTIAAGKGMLVQTTTTLNTYDYHRLVVDEAGVANAQTLVSDFNERYRIGSSNPTSSLDDGDLFFNTSTDKMLVYNATGSSWDEVQSVGNFFINTISSYSGTGGNSASFNGSAYRFVISNPGANAQQHIVSVNGVIQKPTTGTSQPAEGFAIDGSSILFSSAPATGSDYFIITVGAAVGIGTPSDNTVDTDIIQNLAVTQAKLAAEAVNESKLQVSNAPTNGYYLQAQSGNTGGLTWAAVSQYTTPLTTRGDILFRDASGDQRLAKGTAGQYLKIGANDPEWADVIGAVANGCIYENSQTISNNHTIAAGQGAHSVGPITVSATVTVNGRWVIS